MNKRIVGEISTKRHFKEMSYSLTKIQTRNGVFVLIFHKGQGETNKNN